MRVSRTHKKVERPDKELLQVGKGDILWPLAFILSVSMGGLGIFVGYLFALCILFNRLNHDRYDVLLMVVLFLCGSSMHNLTNGYFNLPNISLLVSFPAVILLRKTPIIKKVFWVLALYIVGLLAIASTSDESMMIQSYGYRLYFAFIFIFTPFLIFSGREFDIKILFRKILIYALIFCSLYIIDSAIVGGALLLPFDASWSMMGITSSINNLWANPLSMNFPRRWPEGLYILSAAMYPLARYYKLNIWQWLLILGALAVCRTFSFIIACIIGYIVCTGSLKRMALYFVVAIGAISLLYYIDGLLPESVLSGEDGLEVHSSALRIKSQIDQ